MSSRERSTYSTPRRSLRECRERVEEGCLVLLYIDERRRFIFRARRGGVKGSDKGVLRHDDVIGLPYGSRVRLSTGVEAWILKPRPIDLIELHHRRATQIIYPKDASMIISLAGIGPGSRVVEVGVGSAALTTMLAWSVAPDGHVYGYETRRANLEAARRNLEEAGLADLVTLHHADARAGVEEDGVDAFIVDVPDPWSLLGVAHRSLRGSGVFVAYMPAVNQVVRLLEALVEHGGFIGVGVYEVLVREYIPRPDTLRPRTTMVAHTGYILSATRINLNHTR